MITINQYVPDFHRIPIICGPTASGKSAMAIEICRQIHGELFSMDSMQIYKGMNIGTAKASRDEQDEIPHHLLDLIRPSESFSPIQYLDHAYNGIEDCLNRGRMPVFCGGTGQYASALVKGIEYIPIDILPEVREQLFEDASRLGFESLYNELSLIDPCAAAKIHPNNQKRVLRALEIYRQTGKTMTYFNEQSTKNGPRYPFSLFAISVEREQLYRRIDARVDEMIESGLIQEVERLLAQDETPGSTALQAIGYKELIQYLQGTISLSEAIDEIKSNSRHYAKRQMTWFTHMDNIIWIQPNDRQRVLDTIQTFG